MQFSRAGLAGLLLALVPTVAAARGATPGPAAAARAEEPAAPEDAARVRPVANAKLPPGFEQLAVPRPDGSAATVFVGGAAPAEGEARPLFLYLEGSGAQSLFYLLEDGRVAMGMFGLVARHAGDRYRVAAVEKRGVPFGHMGTRGTAEGAPAEYAEHATLSARAADVRLAVDALVGGGGIDASRVVLVGHSEGADVAAAAAAENPAVTHVAFLSGGGAPQFFDFFVLRRRALEQQGATPDEIEAAMSAYGDEVRAVLADPASTTELWLGHAHRRWSTFATEGAADALVRAPARLFVAHGSADTSVPIESFDYLVTCLLIAGRNDATIRRYAGRDHSFTPKGEEGGYEGFLEVLDDVLAWADGD